MLILTKTEIVMIVDLVKGNMIGLWTIYWVLKVKCKLEITRERLMNFAETYEEAIDDLLYIVNNKEATGKEYLETLLDYEQRVREDLKDCP